MSINEAEIRNLAAIREAAEKVVEGMPDGPMKVKAFEMAFQSLQTGGPKPAAGKGRRRSRKAPRAAGEQATPKPRKPSGPQGHIRELVREAFLDEWRDLTEIQSQLAVRGHHYEQVDLGKPLLRLTRAKIIRRERRQRNGGREIWAYRRFDA